MGSCFATDNRGVLEEPPPECVFFRNYLSSKLSMENGPDRALTVSTALNPKSHPGENRRLVQI